MLFLFFLAFPLFRSSGFTEWKMGKVWLDGGFSFIFSSSQDVLALCWNEWAIVPVYMANTGKGNEENET